MAAKNPEKMSRAMNGIMVGVRKLSEGGNLLSKSFEMGAIKSPYMTNSDANMMMFIAGEPNRRKSSLSDEMTALPNTNSNRIPNTRPRHRSDPGSHRRTAA